MSAKKPVFSVAAYTYGKYSETFIQNHAEKIFPEDTFLIALNPDAKFLSPFREGRCFRFAPSRSLLPKKLDSIFRYIFFGSVFYPGNKNIDQLAKFMKEMGIQVLLAEYGTVGCAVEKACRNANVDLFVHFHGFDASRLLQHWHVKSSYLRLSRTAKGFIFPSNFLATQLCAEIGLNRGKNIHVVPCCVRLDDFRVGQFKDQNLVLAIGRFVPKKAPQKTILAFSKVVRHFPKIRLEMIGDGDLLQTCQDLVQTLGIEDRVIFHGSKPHEFVKEKLNTAVLFLQHSVTAPSGDTEGLGVSLLEAMASGAVVVATRHNGFVETVVDGETGFLIDEHDVNAMASSCIRLLGDQRLLDSMRQKARERVEKYYTVDQQIIMLRRIMGLADVC